MDTLTRRTIRSRTLYYKLRNRWRNRRRRRASNGGGPDFYKSVWGQAAAEVGVPITYIDGSFFEIRCPQAVLRVRCNITSLDDPVTVAIAGDRPLVNRLLSERGLPVPQSCACRYSDVSAGWSFAAELGRPCVVKPARGTGGGTGITTGVSTSGRLAGAMARAGSYCNEVVIEEQVLGDNYRLLYLDGELIDALQRRPPCVRGDGKSSVRELMEAEDEGRVRLGSNLLRRFPRTDREMRQALREAGREMDSIPAAGEIVCLTSVVSQHGGHNVSVTDSVCPSVAESGAMAAAAVGVRLAGVDIVTSDPAVPLIAAAGAIIEVNTGPGLHYHYKTAGDPVPVALLILQRLCAATR